MRFKRSDWPGIAIALLAGPAAMVLFLAAFDVWDHRGTPLLGFMATNLAVGVGLAAIFSRFIRNWDLPVALLGVLVVVVAGVNWAQRTGNDDTWISLTLKWVGVVDFLLLNLAVAYQVLMNGLIPILDRRAARRAGTAEGREA